MSLSHGRSGVLKLARDGPAASTLPHPASRQRCIAIIASTRTNLPRHGKQTRPALVEVEETREGTRAGGSVTGWLTALSVRPLITS